MWILHSKAMILRRYIWILYIHHFYIYIWVLAVRSYRVERCKNGSIWIHHPFTENPEMGETTVKVLEWFIFVLVRLVI